MPRLALALALLSLSGCAASQATAGDTSAPPPQSAFEGGSPMSYEAICQGLIDAQSARTDADRLHALFAAHWEWLMAEFPGWATYVGDTRHDDRWGDPSVEAALHRKQVNLKTRAVLDTLHPDTLSRGDQLNYALFRRINDRAIDGDRFPEELLPLNQMGGVQQDPISTLAAMPRFDAADYEALLARLRALPALVDGTVDTLEAGLAAGITPPRIILRDVPDQVAALLSDDLAHHPILAPFDDFPASIDEASQARIRGEARRILTEEIQPAYRRLHSFLVERYLPGAREAIALTALPDGRAWYEASIRTHTTTDLSPEAIHEIGLKEVARIDEAMRAVIRETGFKGSFQEFTTFLRTDPRFFYTTPEALLTAYRDIAKRVDPMLITQFGHLPRLPYGVKAIPAHSAPSQTTAYYYQGSLAAGRPGWFYANTYDLPSRPSWEMEALTFHEAVPGHHLQISIAQELTGLPTFRTQMGNSAFEEGWALYSEGLGYEMGFYADPYSRFGQLTYEMWRAVRLVVDTGIHAMGWSREQAIQYFMDHTSKAEHDIVVEVDRYIAWPGQALAYKIGQLKIAEIRATAEAALGDRFDVRAFHDALLSQGPLPLDVLTEEMDAWVAAQAGGGAR